MASDINGLPHWEVGFDANGRLVDEREATTLVNELPARGVTDLIVFSHGWNNDRGQARALYRRFLEQIPGILARFPADRRRPWTLGTLGVFWPSKRWADEDLPGAAGGAAGLDQLDDRTLVEDLRDVFPEPRQQAALEELARLLADRPDDPEELARFQRLMSELASGSGSAGGREDSGELALTEEDAEVVFERFAAEVPRRRREGEAGFGDFARNLTRNLWDGAKEALRQLTYYEMKQRGGVVGQDGLGPLLGRLQAARPALRVHLVGHSFGARLVSFALAGLPSRAGQPSVVKSLVLLQGAFSHFAFADALPFDRGRGGALKGMAARVDGPLVACYSIHDHAVGRLYPLASLRKGDDAAATDDPLFRWGGIGHDGAQAVNATQQAVGAIGQRYGFRPGTFTNLDAATFVKNGRWPAGAHSDIFHPELVWVVLHAAGALTTP